MLSATQSSLLALADYAPKIRRHRSVGVEKLRAQESKKCSARKVDRMGHVDGVDVHTKCGFCRPWAMILFNKKRPPPQGTSCKLSSRNKPPGASVANLENSLIQIAKTR